MRPPELPKFTFSPAVASSDLGAPQSRLEKDLGADQSTCQHSLEALEALVPMYICMICTYVYMYIATIVMDDCRLPR